ncbi:nucleotidyltransferase family protein [Novosphingobium sp.]|uniref:nucleotidyltransferase family protein n=1 Tax=Novosphingobium sp. TaxID=1874826 RepID=UPI002FE10C67
MPSGAGVLSDLCQCLKGHVPPAIDWEAVLGLANRTLVTPALAAALASEAEIPSEVAGLLQVIAERTAIRNRLMHAQLAEAVAACNAAGIKPILLKGAALLARRGPDCADRLLTDLDLMVREEEGAEAIAALERIGYGRFSSTHDDGQGVNLGRERDAGGLDLHYRLKRVGRGRDAAWLAASCRPFAIGEARAAMPSPAALAALFVLHDQLQEGDYWRGRIDLRHLVDLAAIARDEGGIDGAALAALFPQARARRALAVQLDTLAEWLGVRIAGDRRGWRVAFQAWRRRAQLRRPGTETAFTLTSWLIDPPFGLFEHSGAAARGREVRRMLLEKKATKV